MDTRTTPSTPPSRPPAPALLCAALLACALASSPPRAFAQGPAAPTQARDARDGLHDFDFVIGHWKAHLRKLLHPLTGSTDWIVYDGTSVMTTLWEGRANMEEFDVTSVDPRAAERPRIEGQTLRLYDPVSHQWSIWLADAAKGRLSTPPTVGAFDNGRGELFDAEEFDGHQILVRYVWTRPTPDTAHMEQSFSPDWGRTWEVNWICDLAPDAR